MGNTSCEFDCSQGQPYSLHADIKVKVDSKQFPQGTNVGNKELLIC